MSAVRTLLVASLMWSMVRNVMDAVTAFLVPKLPANEKVYINGNGLRP